MCEVSNYKHGDDARQDYTRVRKNENICNIYIYLIQEIYKKAGRKATTHLSLVSRLSMKESVSTP